MTQAFLMVLLDIMVTLLLTATIIYCWKLNRRIRILQDSKSELAQLIRKFDESTQLATRSITEIHHASKKISETIKSKLEKANYIADDLSFMIEKGNKLADRMEGNLSGGRALARRTEDVSTLSRPARAREAEELFEASAEGGPRLARNNAAAKEKKVGALEHMLEKMSISTSGAAAQEKRPRAVGARMRSQTEQELYDALKAKH